MIKMTNIEQFLSSLEVYKVMGDESLSWAIMFYDQDLPSLLL